ncbi:MAG: mandelate racemase/muconate lactonizing enzyme family protein [Bryobacteraceae bacterium]
MKITDVTCTVLVVPDCQADACDSAQDTIVVTVHTDDGLVGLGEVDANPWIIKATIEAPGTHIMSLGLKELLMGQDPCQPAAIWDRLYTFTAMSGRRGAGICAIGALDIAIWDLYGKATSRPVWQLLGGERQGFITPYASLLPSGRTLQAYQTSLVAKAKWAKDYGFRAAKMEVIVKGPYAHNLLFEDDEAVVDIVAACREAVGPGMVMMVDVAYAWSDWKAALRVLRQLERYDVFFVETPLRSDDLDGYARLSDATSIRIAAGEWLNSRFEFAELMDHGRIDVAQPDVGRVGGLTEAMRVVEMALDRGKIIVPHCWKTGIGVAASAHLAATSPNCRFIEFLPPSVAESALRRELVAEELHIEDGRLALPSRPGLGIELNQVAMDSFARNADAYAAARQAVTAPIQVNAFT